MATDSDREFRDEFAQAFIHWQAVERELFRIFGYLIAGAQGGAVSAAYNATVNFNTKLGMTDAAAQFLLPIKAGLLTEWSRIHNQIGR